MEVGGREGRRWSVGASLRVRERDRVRTRCVKLPKKERWVGELGEPGLPGEAGGLGTACVGFDTFGNGVGGVPPVIDSGEIGSDSDGILVASAGPIEAGPDAAEEGAAIDQANKTNSGSNKHDDLAE